MSSAQKHPLSGHSLWLVPAAPADQDLSSLIQHLTTLEPSSPAFDPHITLLHPVPDHFSLNDITNTLQQVIHSDSAKGKSKWSDWTLELQPAQSGTQYYQSVLAPVQPTEALADLRESCRRAFGMDELPKYFPHLSLLYGDLSKERRDQLAGEAQRRFEEQELRREVRVGAVVVVDCAGTVGDWKVVGRVDL